MRKEGEACGEIVDLISLLYECPVDSFNHQEVLSPQRVEPCRYLPSAPAVWEPHPFYLKKLDQKVSCWSPPVFCCNEKHKAMLTWGWRCVCGSNAFFCGLLWVFQVPSSAMSVTIVLKSKGCLVLWRMKHWPPPGGPAVLLMTPTRRKGVPHVQISTRTVQFKRLV